MSVLKVTEVRDLAGIGGFSFSSGSVTALGTLKVNDININGTMSGSSNSVSYTHLTLPTIYSV